MAANICVRVFVCGFVQTPRKPKPLVVAIRAEPTKKNKENL